MSLGPGLASRLTMRPSLISRSPRTMEFPASIVISVPPLMTIDSFIASNMECAGRTKRRWRFEYQRIKRSKAGSRYDHRQGCAVDDPGRLPPALQIAPRRIMSSEKDPVKQ